MFLLGIGVAIFSVMGIFQVNLNRGNTPLSNLALANIEALARGESGYDVKCTVVGYEDVWLDGCLYTCARCAEGYYKAGSLVRCLAR